jgi:hypothetical protein
MDLHIESQMPALTPDQALTGWRREFCVELLGDGRARIFTRMVISPSHKAAELQHGVLFHRVGAAFRDLRSCMQAAAGRCGSWWPPRFGSSPAGTTSSRPWCTTTRPGSG